MDGTGKQVDIDHADDESGGRLLPVALIVGDQIRM
jgi:hypothetical protein